MTRIAAKAACVMTDGEPREVVNMTRIAVKAAYLGLDFYGSQRQRGVRTVEDEMLKALEKCRPAGRSRAKAEHQGRLDVATPFRAKLSCAHASNQPITRPAAPSTAKPSAARNFQSAGRTDRGVSALGMVFAFDREKLNLGQLNHHLPQDICCYAKAIAPPDFNPRFAQERHYRYFLPGGRLDVAKMRTAAKALEGTHDFSNFCKKSERNPERTMRKITVNRTHVDFFAESFLWQQVRRMSCAILQAGRDGASSADGFFIPGNPVPPLPPENLVLMGLKYPMDFETDNNILMRFKARMAAISEKKRVEQAVCTSFSTI